MNYWYFSFWGRELYIDLKLNRPFTIELHRDKTNGDVSLWIWFLFILSSRGKPT